MNKLEFIDHYCGDMSIGDKTHFMQTQVVLPCKCGEVDCSGWQMVGNNKLSLKAYNDLYAVAPDYDTIWVDDKTGEEYTVVEFTNLQATNPDYSPTIIYKDSKGEQLSKPLATWFIGLTPKVTS